MIGWAAEAMTASTLLMLVVLALRRPAARHLGPHAAYLLWLLPAVRMILPALPTPAAPVRPPHLHLDLHLLPPGTAPAGPAAAASPVVATALIDWTLPLLGLWLLGAVGFAAWQIGRHARFMQLVRSGCEMRDRHGSVRVISSPAVAGPLAAGLFRPAIFLPADFDHVYTGTERQLALAHEIAHHRRGDLIANAAALLILSLHWFNPIAHWAYRAFRADQELACDATVLRTRPQSRSDYGRALIKAARADMHATACALGPAAELKRRISMIAQSPPRRVPPAVATALILLCVAGGLGLTASVGAAARSTVQPDRARSAQLIHVTAPAMPAMPVPPAPPAPVAPTSVAVPPALPVIAPVPPIPPIPPQRIDAAAITRQAMAEARAELERECRHAKPAPAGETDTAAIARLAAGCVDVAEINREVQLALAEAQDEVRHTLDLSEAQRAKALASIEQARKQMAAPAH